MTAIHYRTADAEGLKVFYREAGRADAPTLLLLHGFPSAGHMFRELMPQLAEQLSSRPTFLGLVSQTCRTAISAYRCDHFPERERL